MAASHLKESLKDLQRLTSKFSRLVKENEEAKDGQIRQLREQVAKLELEIRNLKNKHQEELLGLTRQVQLHRNHFNIIQGVCGALTEPDLPGGLQEGEPHRSGSGDETTGAGGPMPSTSSAALAGLQALNCVTTPTGRRRVGNTMPMQLASAASGEAAENTGSTPADSASQLPSSAEPDTGRPKRRRLSTRLSF